MTDLRYVIVGAGAIGGTIAGRLIRSGRDVTVVARGAHLAALQERGLLLQSPDDSVNVAVRAVETPDQAAIDGSTVVVLATKTQDSGAVLGRLAAAASAATPIVCAQNGVENERLAIRHFANVYGVHVALPADHLEPGIVRHYIAPTAGILDLGRYPAGLDDTAVAIAADFRAAGFLSETMADVMAWKYTKLLANLANALEAAVGRGGWGSELAGRARAEAVACYAAAGIPWVDEATDKARRAGLPAMRPVGEAGRAGGSSWQSLARGTGSIETDYLNGEIVLLGRLHDVATPVNAALQSIANRMSREHVQPGSLVVADVEAEVARVERTLAADGAPDRSR